MDTISVIVPVYNVQDYLEECIESIIHQSYKELEIILIDDGSTDKSGEICDKYAKIDDRIHVIHQKNGGAANAKNTGLKVATGKYLSFVDSDDYLEDGAYSFMISKIKESRADVIQCCFNEVYRNRVVKKELFNETRCYDTIEYLKFYTQDWTCGLLWDKLYCRSLFNGIFFKEGHKIDDEFFTYKGIMNAKKIIRVPKVSYNYRKRQSSVMLSIDGQEKIISDKLAYLSERRQIVCNKFPDLKQIFDEHYLNMLLILSKEEYVTKDIIDKIKELLKCYYKENNKVNIPMGLKTRLIFLKYCPIQRILKSKIINNKKEVEYYFK